MLFYNRTIYVTYNNGHNACNVYTFKNNACIIINYSLDLYVNDIFFCKRLTAEEVPRIKIKFKTNYKILTSLIISNF